MKTVISSVLILGGVVVMGGSAGDCDGACMDQANSFGEMIMYATMGLGMFIAGAVVAIKDNA